MAATADPPRPVSHSSLECRVCLEPFSDTGERLPRTLPACGHTFCHTCLGALLKTTWSSQKTAKCPLCQRESRAKELENFHPCFALIDVLNSQPSPPPPPTVPPCANCTSNPANFWCAKCEGFVCGTCWDIVHQLPLLRAHQKESPTARMEAAAIAKKEEAKRCAAHPSQSRDFICVDLDCPLPKTPICPLCERKSHKGHRTMLVEELAEGRRVEIKFRLACIDSAASTVNRSLVEVQETSRSLRLSEKESSGERTSEQKALMLVRERFRRYHEQLEVREMHLLNLIQHLASAKFEILEQQSRELTRFLTGSYRLTEQYNKLLLDADDFTLLNQLPAVERGFEMLKTSQLHLTPQVDPSIILSLPEADQLLGQLGTVAPELPLKIATQSRKTAFLPPFQGKYVRKINPGLARSANMMGERPRLDSLLCTHSGIALDSTQGILYVADSLGDRILVINASNGTSLRTFGSSGSEEGNLWHPTAVAVDTTLDALFVSEWGNDRIQVFRASNGKFLRAFGSSGQAHGQFRNIWAIAMHTKTSTLFVADTDNHRVQAFRASDGKFVRTFGSEGSGECQFQHPYGLAVDDITDSLFVADSGNSRVQVFRASDGTFLRQFGSELPADHKLNWSMGIALDNTQGVLFVSDWSSSQVRVFRASDGTFLRRFDSGYSKFNKPWGLTFDQNTGSLFVYDKEGADQQRYPFHMSGPSVRIQVFQ